MARERLSLESSLRHAVKREQLELYYQPKWDFHRQAIVGAEALIRWTTQNMDCYRRHVLFRLPKTAV